MPSAVRWFGDAVKRYVRDRASANMDRTGKLVVARARQLVPVRTGQLRDSIGYQYNQSTMTLTIYADMSYAPYIELGTSRMRAQPYIRPAIEAGKQAWSGTITTTVV